MSKFLKNFKNQFTGLLGLIIVVLLAGYLVYSNFYTSTFLNFIKHSLPYILLGVAIIIAVLKNKHLIAYLILMIEYSGKAISFMQYILEFKFNNQFPWMDLIAFIIFIFLMLQVVSHAFDTGGGKAPWTNVAITIFVAFIVEMYFKSNFYSGLFLLFYPIIGYIGGSPLIASLLLMSTYIISPFNLIDSINNKAAAKDIVYFSLGVVILCFAIYHVIDRIKKEK